MYAAVPLHFSKKKGGISGFLIWLIIYRLLTLIPCLYLRIQVPEDIHSRLLHHCKQIGIVLGPLHIPDIFALQFQQLANYLLPCTVCHPSVQVKESQDSCDVDDSKTTASHGIGREKFKILSVVMKSKCPQPFLKTPLSETWNMVRITLKLFKQI